VSRVAVTSTICRAAHPFGCARCGAGAGCSAIRYRSLFEAPRATIFFVPTRSEIARAVIGVQGYSKYMNLLSGDRVEYDPEEVLVGG